MNIRDLLLHKIEDWCRWSGTSERALAVAATRSPNAVRRIRFGATVTTRTIEAIERHIEAHPVCGPLGQDFREYVRERNGLLDDLPSVPADQYSHGEDERGYNDAS
jgi:hypothetical protein